jgi:hypothetical protein
MAGEASHDAFSVEIVLIDFADHENHFARAHFGGHSVTFKSLPVAIIAIDIERAGDERHRAKQIRGGHSFEYLNVLENFFGRQQLLRLLPRSLCDALARDRNRDGNDQTGKDYGASCA